jgi:AAA ATPase domain
MPQSRYTILMNAFRPAQEVDDPSFFAGRAREVARLTDALHLIGSTPLIYGDRGLGKTSLAVQIMRIAVGDVQLLSALRLEDRAFNETERYIPIPVVCTDSTRNFDGLLQELIHSAEAADSMQGQPSYRAKHLAERTVSLTLNLKIIQRQSTKRYVPEETRPSYEALSPTEKLQYLISDIVDTYRQPVLFVIDELDRLQNTRGLASFIKATSSEFVKFVLVGIASNIGDLLADHQSIERHLIAVQVPRMNDEELRQIVANAETYLNRNGQAVQFGYLAANTLARYAQGFPWFVHVLGQSALLKAIEAQAGRNLTTDERRSIQVWGVDVDEARYEMSTNHFAQQFSDMYSKIVGDSYQREIVLRAFALWPGVDIPLSEVYRILKSRLDVPNPSAYKSELASPEFGRVIYTPEGRHQGEVRFANGMFKAYIRLTRSTYEDVANRVSSAFEALR